MRQYVVDAFADRVFEGNPAAVCLPETWPGGQQMLSIARENRLPETAFAVRKGADWHLRWFAPSGEVSLCGHATLAAAYAILLTFGMAIAVAVLPICAAMLFLGTLGTLLIFKSLSGFVVKLVQSRPGLYFRGLNLFTLRQWLSRVHSTYLSMTVICILLLLAVGITASSIGLNSTLEAAADEEAPFDLTVQNQSADSAGLVDFPAVLAEGGFDLDRLGEQLDVLFYYNDPAVTGVEEVSAAIRLSDYNALLAHGGRGSCHEEVPMVPDDPERRAVTGGLSLSYAVVPDELAGQLEVRRQVWFVDYAGGDEERTEAELLQLIRPLDLDYALHFSSRLDAYQSIMGPPPTCGWRAACPSIRRSWETSSWPCFWGCIWASPSCWPPPRFWPSSS